MFHYSFNLIILLLYRGKVINTMFAIKMIIVATKISGTTGGLMRRDT